MSIVLKSVDEVVSIITDTIDKYDKKYESHSVIISISNSELAKIGNRKVVRDSFRNEVIIKLKYKRNIVIGDRSILIYPKPIIKTYSDLMTDMRNDQAKPEEC